MSIATVTLGFLFVSPLHWRFGPSDDREGQALLWTLYLGPLFITLGIEGQEVRDV